MLKKIVSLFAHSLRAVCWVALAGAMVLALVVPQVVPPVMAASVLSVSKTNYERFNVSVDFSAVVPSADISLYSVTATLAGTNTDKTSDVVSSSPAPAVVSGTSTVVVQVVGGTVGQVYKVAVKVLRTDTGERFEGDVQLTVTS